MQKERYLGVSRNGAVKACNTVLPKEVVTPIKTVFDTIEFKEGSAYKEPRGSSS